MFGSYDKIKKKGLDIEAILKNYSKQNNGGKKKSNFKVEDEVEEEQAEDEEIIQETAILMTREKTLAKQVKVAEATEPKKQ
jgi:hypothetical protein